MSINPKPQAASHMFWFFLLPCLGFMGWAAVKLVTNVGKKETPTTLISKVEKIKNAKSPGDRWQNAYALSQDLQKIMHTGGLAQISTNDKTKLFSELSELLEKNSSDTRLKRYLLLTLGQMRDPLALPILQKHLKDLDPEVKFFASWGFIEILSHNKSSVEPEHLVEISGWLDSSDTSLQKVSASFLVQQNKPELTDLVKKQLSSPSLEVKWNAAVALASVKDPSSSQVLKNLFDLDQLRLAHIKSTKDLEQLIATATDAAVKLGDAGVLTKAYELRRAMTSPSPEAQAIVLGLRALPSEQAAAPAARTQTR